MKKKLMKSMALGAVVFATIGTAQAGVFGTSNVQYATEIMHETSTELSHPAVTYTLGVARAVDANMVFIYTLPEGVTFASVPDLTPVADVAHAIRRGGAIGDDYVAFEMVVGGAGGIVADTDFILQTFSVDVDETAQVSGTTYDLQLEIMDAAENAYVDNAGPVSAGLIEVTQATNFYDVNLVAVSNPSGFGLSQDTETEVNAENDPPMAGFSDTGAGSTVDSQYQAVAEMGYRYTDVDIKSADGATPYSPANGAAFNFTITDEDGLGFIALAAEGPLATDGLALAVGAGIYPFTIDGNTASVTLTGLEATGDVGEAGSAVVLYNIDGQTRMNTSHSFDVAGEIEPAVDPTNVLAFDGAEVTPWWVWGSNGTVLQAPLAQMPGGWICRTILTSTAGTPIEFSVSTLSEDGVTVTPVATGGEIPASGTLVNDCSDWYTADSPGQRASLIFTINGANSNVQGLYQMANATTGVVSNHVMVRPGTN